MSSYLQNRERGGRLLLPTVVVLIILALDLLSGGVVRGFVRTAAGSVWSVTTNIGDSISASGILASRAKLLRENEELQRTVADLERKIAGEKALEEENVSLRSLVHLVGNNTGVAAPIISSVRSSPYGTFSIGAGSMDGIAAQDIVIASNSDESGFVLGIVSDVSSRSSLVREILAPGFSFQANVHGIPLAVEGEGSGRAQAEAPPSSSIAVGDLVISPQFRNRPIGVVGAIKENVARTRNDVFIGSPVSLSELRYVYVVHP